MRNEMEPFPCATGMQKLPGPLWRFDSGHRSRANAVMRDQQETNHAEQRSQNDQDGAQLCCLFVSSIRCRQAPSTVHHVIEFLPMQLHDVQPAQSPPE
jgi:hypothetical protein